VAFTSAGIKDPQIGAEGKFSLWFLAALALAEGDVKLSKFTDEKVKDPKLFELRQKVNATLVRERKFGAKVCVKMKDGTQYTESREIPKGNPKNPLSLDEISKKFMDNATLAISKGKAEDLFQKLYHFEKLDKLETIFSLMK